MYMKTQRIHNRQIFELGSGLRSPLRNPEGRHTRVGPPGHELPNEPRCSQMVCRSGAPRWKRAELIKACFEKNLKSVSDAAGSGDGGGRHVRGTAITERIQSAAHIARRKCECKCKGIEFAGTKPRPLPCALARHIFCFETTSGR
jgi:hypothetical protein